ncbi:MAG TPA: hypothetical protein VNG89_11395, partial [Vicinamibacterales bacterium]|nr:hypothetical protein [Vicinamibacterales bacterium]
AYSVQFGDGCYFHPQAFYQDFLPSLATPNLANTGIQMIPLTPNNYVVVPTASTIVPPTSTSITLSPPTAGSSGAGNWDDAYLVQALPFTFPYAGGSTSVISIGSNGYIFLNSESSTSFDVSGASYGSIGTFRDHQGRICPFFHDLDPTVGGGIFYEPDTSPTPSFVTITWQNLQEFGVSTALNTFQLKLNSSGLVEINYGALANTSAGNDAIAGFTPGNGARLPPPQNLVATMPFQSGDGSIPPVLGLSARPVLGTSTNLVTTNITAGTLFVFQVTGFGTIPAGVNLAPIGMPGCFQYVVPVSSLLLPVIGGQSSTSIFIPNVPSFAGTVVSSQAAPLTAGLNAAGILASNGVCMKIGL